MHKVIMGLLAVIMVMPVMAVDGYKNLKFGMSPKEVKETKICKFTETGDQGNLMCQDLLFSGKKTSAFALFVDEKFGRLAIALDGDNQFFSVAQGLYEKYGDPSTPVTKEELRAVDTLPNQKADVGYDNDTVWLRALSDEFNAKSYMLIYTLNTYDELSMAEENKKNKDDL